MPGFLVVWTFFSKSTATWTFGIFLRSNNSVFQPFSVAARDLEYAIFEDRASSNVHIKGFPKFDSNTILKLQLLVVFFLFKTIF